VIFDLDFIGISRSRVIVIAVASAAVPSTSSLLSSVSLIKNLDHALAFGVVFYLSS
jgi:hypothetical protein